ncbi:MAG: hypothetical protein Q8930_17400, partial [Bacillota bacterium]|nr:hypothetical protein [Bacillota bacterium]
RKFPIWFIPKSKYDWHDSMPIFLFLGVKCYNELYGKIKLQRKKGEDFMIIAYVGTYTGGTLERKGEIIQVGRPVCIRFVTI